jgi:hypothetical protein
MVDATALLAFFFFFFVSLSGLWLAPGFLSCRVGQVLLRCWQWRRAPKKQAGRQASSQTTAP